VNASDLRVLMLVILVPAVAALLVWLSVSGHKNPCETSGYHGYQTPNLGSVSDELSGPGWVCTEAGQPVFTISTYR
jgi:hypothetical protein